MSCVMYVYVFGLPWFIYTNSLGVHKNPTFSVPRGSLLRLFGPDFDLNVVCYVYIG